MLTEARTGAARPVRLPVRATIRSPMRPRRPKRLVPLALALAALTPSTARAQAPPSGPVVLLQPATPRAAALGGAWVAGRDQDVLFYNPAQLIGARPGFDVSFMRYGRDATQTTFTSVYAAGKWSLTLGWGVTLLHFRADPAAAYPYSSDVVLSGGAAQGSGALVTIGGAIVVKGFRIGAAGKYVVEHVSMPPGFSGADPARQSAIVADLGLSRPLFGGTAAAAAQNLGPDSLDAAGLVKLPKQGLFGWSRTKVAGPLDLLVVGQVTVRDDWTSPAAGLEAGYSWIEGYFVSIRAGVRRPESSAEHPYSLGAAFTADRLAIEYGVRFFDGGRAAGGVLVRWR